MEIDGAKDRGNPGHNILRGNKTTIILSNIHGFDFFHCFFSKGEKYQNEKETKAIMAYV